MPPTLYPGFLFDLVSVVVPRIRKSAFIDYDLATAHGEDPFIQNHAPERISQAQLAALVGNCLTKEDGPEILDEEGDKDK
jgi:hypothetical protein